MLLPVGIAVVIALAAILVSYFYDVLNRRYHKANDESLGYIYILEERDVEEDPLSLAVLMIQEAETVWASHSWYQEVKDGSLLVESKPVEGPLSANKLPVQRAFNEVNCTSSDALFKLMTSPDGFAIIDPITPKEEHLLPPILSYPWDNGRLEVSKAAVPLPKPFTPREFVVFNVIDEVAKIFVSKSILPPQAVRDHPTNHTVVTALNTFAIKIEDIFETDSTAAATDATADAANADADAAAVSGAKHTGRCRFLSVDYAAGVVGILPLAHYVNAALFYPGLFSRLNDHMTKNGTP